MDAWYYATGGRQNGPIPLSELIRLYATGTVGPKDLVWREGMSNWQPAEEVPDLRPPPAVRPPAPPAAMEGTAGPLNPYQVSASNWHDPSSSAADLTGEIVPGSQALLVGAIISRAWELTKRHFALILGVGITYLLLRLAGNVICELAAAPFVIRRLPNGGVVLSEFGQMVAVVMGVLNQILNVFLTLGLTRIGLNLVSGKPAEFGMLFGESSKLVNGVIAYFLFTLMVVLGLFLLVVPGIYLALRFGQFQIAIVDKNLGAIEAFRYSSRITEGNKWNILGLFAVFFLIVLAGALALGVGLIVAIPIITLGQYLAYRWLQYGQAAVRDQAARLP